MKTIILITTSTCAPCRVYKPVLQDFCDDRGYALEIVTDPTRDIVTKYGLTKVPTTIVMENSREINKITTALTRKELEKEIG